MNDYRRAVRTALYLVYAFGVLLILAAVGLPFGVTWYVEAKGRDQTLPATIMLTSYPCMPFVGIAILSVKKLLNNVLSGLILGDKNISLLRAAALSCFAVTAITVAAGRLYKPFFIVALCAAACGVTLYSVKSIFGVMLSEQREKEARDIEENL